MYLLWSLVLRSSADNFSSQASADLCHSMGFVIKNKEQVDFKSVWAIHNSFYISCAGWNQYSVDLLNVLHSLQQTLSLTFKRGGRCMSRNCTVLYFLCLTSGFEPGSIALLHLKHLVRFIRKHSAATSKNVFIKWNRIVFNLLVKQWRLIIKNY